MKLFALIMAGGVGSRFWPRSKEKTPKQLLKIFGDNTMIQDTVARLNGVIPNENIFVITNKVQRDEIIKQLPGVPQENILEEPFGRNTAACVGLASIMIEEKSKDALTVVLPADHIIRDKVSFHNTLKSAAKFADESKGLVTIGIIPTRPETGYGYIQIDDNIVSDNIHKVLTFAEKPNYATAVSFWKAVISFGTAACLFGELILSLKKSESICLNYLKDWKRLNRVSALQILKKSSDMLWSA